MKLFRCTSCKLAKGEDDFYENRASRTGHDNLCKLCRGKVNASEGAKASRARYKARKAGLFAPKLKRGWKAAQ